jgi:HEAT repeats
MISPRVVSKHTPDCSSPEAVVKSIIKPSMSSEAKALAIWEYLWKNTWHWPAPKEHRRETHELDVVFDANKLLNVYGYSYCYAIRSLGEALYQAAGMESRSGGIGGHVITEVYYDGKWHFLDHDQRGFSRLPDGSIASLEEYGGGAARELVLAPKSPSKPFFPAVLRPEMVYEQKQIFTGYVLNQQVHYRQHDKFRTAHSMNLALVPGMRFTRFFDHNGKWHCPPGMADGVKANGYSDPWKGPVELIADLFKESRSLDDGEPMHPGNGLLVYRPDLRAGKRHLEEGAYNLDNVDTMGHGFGPQREGRFAIADFRVRLPYVIAGWPGDVAKSGKVVGAAVVSGKCMRASRADRVRVLVSTDCGGHWEKVWEADETGEREFAVDFSNLVEGRYSYILRVEMRGARQRTDVRMLELGIDTACQLNPAVLPAVRPGANSMTVSVDQGGEVFDEFVQYAEKADHERLMTSSNNVRIQKDSYPALQPVGRGKPGSVVYAMHAPKGRRIVWAKAGGAFRSHWDVAEAPDEIFRIYYALERPKDWQLAWEADRAPYLGHWCFETDQIIKVEKPAKVVYVKYELQRSRLRGSGGRMVAARLVWGCSPERGKTTQDEVRVEHVWTEKDVEKHFSSVVSDRGGSYSFNAGKGKVRNVSLAVEPEGRGPVVAGPHALMRKRPKAAAHDLADPVKVPAMLKALKRLDKSPTAATAADLMWNCKHPLVRDTAPAALLAIGGEAARRELKKAIGKRSRAEDCYLDLLAIEGPFEGLAERLEDKGAGRRRTAAQLLGTLGAPGAAGALRAAIAREKSPRARAAQCEALLRCAGRNAVAEVEKLLAGMPARAKIAVAGALAELGVESALEALGAALKADNQYIRFEAAATLAVCGHSEAEAHLLKALRDKSHWVRREAIAGLGRLGGVASNEALERVSRRDPHKDLRSEAQWALGEIGGRHPGSEKKAKKAGKTRSSAKAKKTAKATKATKATGAGKSSRKKRK